MIFPRKLPVLSVFFRTVTIGLSLAGLLLSCENPVRGGLGEKLDIYLPRISVEEPLSGKYLQNEVTFKGKATDDRHVARVEFGFHEDLENGQRGVKTWFPVTTYDGTENWIVELDTMARSEDGKRQYPDGDYILSFRVKDSDNNIVETEDLVYKIKNNPSTINLTEPLVTDGDMAGDPLALNLKRMTGTPIKIFISDRKGIAEGFSKIKFWPANLPEPGGPDSLEFATSSNKYLWQPMDLSGGIRVPGATLNSAEFTFPLNKWEIDAAGNRILGDALDPTVETNEDTFYRYRIWVKDTMDEAHENIYPPPDKEALKLNVLSSTERPQINLEPPVTPIPPKPHEFIEESVVYKGENASGGFVLRVRITHPMGIDYARLSVREEGSAGAPAELYWDGDFPGNPADALYPANNRYPGSDLPRPGETENGPGKVFTFTYPYSDSRPSFNLPTGKTYEFVVNADISGSTNDRIITVYWDSNPPDITITGVTGAYKAPLSAADTYVLNGTVAVNYVVNDDKAGILTETIGAGEEQTSRRVVKYRLLSNTADASEIAALNSHISDIGSLASQTYLRSRIDDFTGHPGDPSALLIATKDFSDGLYTLYILSQDKAANIGINRQESSPGLWVSGQPLEFKQISDKPETEFPDANLINPGINTEAGLDISFGWNANLETDSTIGNTSRKNVLNSDQGIPVSIADDDGIDIRNGGITVVVETALKQDDGTTPRYSGSIQYEDYTSPGAPGIQSIFGLGAPNLVTPVKSLADKTIPPASLAAALSAGGCALSTPGKLNDGVYKLTITVKDLSSAKLGTGAAVESEEQAIVLWFAVHDESPEIVIDVPQENSYQGDAPLAVEGTVKSRTDIKKFGISFPGPGAAGTITTEDSSLSSLLTLTPPVGTAIADANGYFNYDWAYTNTLSVSNERKRITLVAADRYNYRTTGVRNVIVDRVPPLVANPLVNPVVNPGVSQTLNGKVKVSVSPSDANGIQWVKYLALPFIAPAPDRANLAVLSEADLLAALNGAGWKDLATNGEYFVYLDTGNLTDGQKYIIYVLARDNAGNLSDSLSNPSLLGAFTFTVDQAGDYPKVNSDDVRPQTSDFVGLDRLTIEGTVSDDDGFSDGSRNSRVELWVSRSPAFDDVLAGAGWKAASGTPVGSRDLSFSLNLLNTFPSGAERTALTGSDGLIYYQVRVTDDPVSKNPDGAVSGGTGYSDPLTSTAPSAMPGYFSFNLDSIEPGIYFGGWNKTAEPPVVTAPYAENRPFKNSPSLHGSIKEANLIVQSSNPYIEYSLDGGDRISIPVTHDSSDWYDWTLPLIGSAIWDALSDGYHSITIFAEDKSGKTRKESWGFYKDTTGPLISFTNITQVQLPVKPAAWDSMNDTAKNTWLDDTRTALIDAYSINSNAPSGWGSMSAAQKEAWVDAVLARAPFITALGGSAPSLRGTFNDSYSHIAAQGQTVYFQYRFDYRGTNDGEADSSWNNKQIPAPAGGTVNTVNWEIGGADGGWSLLTDGEHTLDIAVYDETSDVASRANRRLIKNLYFKIDTAKPVINNIDPENSNALNPRPSKGDPANPVFGQRWADGNDSDDVFTLIGFVEDENLSELNFRLDGWPTGQTKAAKYANPSADDPFYKAGDTAPLSGEPLISSVKRLANGKIRMDYSWVIEKADFKVLGLDGSHLQGQDGDYNIIITARDQTSRSEERVWTFHKDSTSPLVEFSNMETGIAATTFTAAPLITGNASDDNKVQSLEYKIIAWNYGANTTGGDWDTGLAIPGITVNTWIPFAITPAVQASWSLDLSSVLTTNGKYRINIRAKDGSHNDTSALAGNPSPDSLYEKVFYVDLALPVISLTNPQSYDKGAGGVVIFNGTLSDANRIQSALFKLNNSSLGSGASAITLGGNASDTSRTFTITVPVGSLPAGQQTIYLRATDNAGRETAILSHDFTLDRLAPDLEVISDGHDVNTGHVTGRVTIIGSTSDDPPTPNSANDVATGVKSVSYSLGNAMITANTYKNLAAGDPESQTVKAGTTTLAAFTGINQWELVLKNIGYFSDPSIVGTVANWVSETGSGTNIWILPLKFKIVDMAGNESIVSHNLSLDPDADSVKIIFEYPSPATPDVDRIMSNETQVRGLAMDNDYVMKIVYRVLDAGNNPIPLTGAIADSDTNTELGIVNPNEYWYTGIPTGSLGAQVGWNFSVNSAGELNPVYPEVRKAVKIQVRGWDADEDNRSLLRLLGRDYIVPVLFEAGAPEIVEYRFKKGPSTGWSWDTSSSADAYSPSGNKLSESFSIRTLIRDESGISSIKLSKESNASFTDLLFNNGALIDYSGYDAALSGTLAADGIAYKAEPWKVVGADDFVNGTKYIIWEPGNVFESFGLDSTTASGTNNKRFTEFTATGPGTGTGTAIPASQVVAGETYYDWIVTIDIDSARLKSGAFANLTGQYNLYLQVQDITNARPLTQSAAITVNIDNFYPLAQYTGSSSASGQHYLVQGAAQDSGTNYGGVQELEKVVAWFSRTGAPITINGTSFSFANSNPAVKVRAVKGRHQDGMPAVPWGAGVWTDFRLPAAYPSSVTIDKNAPRGDPTESNISKRFNQSAANTEWYAEIDTTGIDDGPVTLHYAVFDKAGNVSYYEQTLVIRNQAPVVTGIEFGTDLYSKGSTANGGVTSPITINFQDVRVDNAAGVTFTARNKLLTFKVYTETLGGGAAPILNRNYTLDYVSGTSMVTDLTDLTAGSIYTIVDPGNTNWLALGAQSNALGTTFMATDGAPPGSTGSVTAYTLVAARQQATSDSSLTDVLYSYSGADFGTETDEIQNTPAAPTTARTNFILKVWDNLEIQQLADFAFIGIKVANTDITVPADASFHDLNPNTETAVSGDPVIAANLATTIANAAMPTALGANASRGGLYNTGTSADAVVKSGHIEPRQGSSITNGNTFTRDTVSGKVILRGFASDDLRIKEIGIKIGGDTEKKILEEDPVSGKLKAAVGVQAYVFDTIDLTHHQVEWAYVWDSETDPASTVIADNVSIQVFVRDYSASLVKTGSLNVDIHPYITSLERDTVKSYNSGLRSKDGYYAFSQGETVYVKGFNLYIGSGTPTLSFRGTAGAAAFVPAGANENNLTFTLQTPEATFEANLKSGAVVLESKGMTAVNNDPKKAVVNLWNRENSPSIAGSANWIDTIKAHIWRSHEIATGNNRTVFDGSDFPSYPAMTVDPVLGNLHASWNHDSNNEIRYNTNNANIPSEPYIFRWSDGFDFTDIAWTRGRTDNNTGYTVLFNGIGLSANNYATWTNSGGLMIRDANAKKRTIQGGDTYFTQHNHWNVERTGYDQVPDQFSNPRIVTKGDAMHVSYYDNYNKTIKYWYRPSSSTLANNPTDAQYLTTANPLPLINGVPARSWVRIDGPTKTAGTLLKTTITSVSPNVTTNPGDPQAMLGAGFTNGIAQSTDAGQYNAIDLTSDGRPVIAYFDATNKTLRLAYTTVDAAWHGADWNVQEPLGADSQVSGAKDANYASSGRYVSMRIDRTGTGDNLNRIHLSFFNYSKNALIYVTGARNAADGRYTFSKSVIVDNVSPVGLWSDISLDSAGRPWISYLDNYKRGYHDAIKAAYKKTAASWESAADWEYMNVPSVFTAQDSRLSIENWPSRDSLVSAPDQYWNAAIGYIDAERFRVAYYVKED